ncbi:hypothetical protein IE81DRAFT_320192 [Ceraceosorus guamensis]|uniref:Uncharacterized protein n=1 Tax=Ceraceosorus guamensis TaxID=1522189 RepID=A0A316W746_9BASI|nr:hypothetical protein IE81DRAFT_320192 [Ceraceosorus guamensis]PWN45434.1 hypothetical protein IE81DRAFT_320192 [Ceraceosorus guamensis]
MSTAPRMSAGDLVLSSAWWWWCTYKSVRTFASKDSMRADEGHFTAAAIAIEPVFFVEISRAGP